MAIFRAKVTSEKYNGYMLDSFSSLLPSPFLSGHPEFRPRDLFALWEEHRVEYVSSQLVPSSAGHSRTASSENTLLLPQAIESINESRTRACFSFSL